MIVLEAIALNSISFCGQYGDLVEIVNMCVGIIHSRTTVRNVSFFNIVSPFTKSKV